jgi:hypothetical protein
MIYDETGHCPNWERPEDVAAHIAAFVPRGSLPGDPRRSSPHPGL